MLHYYYYYYFEKKLIILSSKRTYQLMQQNLGSCFNHKLCSYPTDLPYTSYNPKEINIQIINLFIYSRLYKCSSI